MDELTLSTCVEAGLLSHRQKGGPHEIREAAADGGFQAQHRLAREGRCLEMLSELFAPSFGVFWADMDLHAGCDANKWPMVAPDQPWRGQLHR